MTWRILAVAFVLITSLAMPKLALAADDVRFHRTNFEAARAAKKPIIIWVQAPWCPVCKVQKPIIDKLVLSSEFKDVILYRLDFDQQKAEWARLGASTPATLIIFREGKEAGRSAGITDRGKIVALLRRAL